MSKPFSPDHQRAGMLLAVMMQHHQITVNKMAELLGVGKPTVISYRIGKITIPYDKMNRMIEILQPGTIMRLNFESACQMANHSAWMLAGKSPNTGRKKPAPV